MAERRDASQVCTHRYDGTGKIIDRRWLGYECGHISQLKYGFTYPGGCAAATWQLARPPEYWNNAMSMGRYVEINRGGVPVWRGMLDQSSPSVQDGWLMGAHGSGTFGNDFNASYTSWNQNQPIDNAITRGLMWRKSSFSSTGLWLSTPFDSGSQKITQFLNLITQQGNMGWRVSRMDSILTLEALPSAPDCILVASTPVGRTSHGNYNVIDVRFLASDDGNGNQTFGGTEVTLASLLAAGIPRNEAYIDLSNAGTMNATNAGINGTNLLQRYVRASFDDPFVIRNGQLLTPGGQPMDIGAANPKVAKLMLLDLPLAGEATAAPITFIVGAYDYDDDSQTASLTAFQSAASDLSALGGNLLAAITPPASS